VRRLLLVGAVLLVLAGVAGAAVWLWAGAGGAHGSGWYARALYPLRYEEAIRTAARHNHLDPALVAAMIYAESRFDPSAHSEQGAVGLMQVLPETAAQIARETGGVAFVPGDLEDPEVNVRYGTYYLRTVLDLFDGDRIAAVAAYNAGAGAVQEWVEEAHAKGRDLRISDIPYPETQAYVRAVLEARRIYRETYADRLGLPS
jgi:soluble lytic murein transglycosylase